MLKANIYNSRIEATKDFANHVYESDTSLILVGTDDKRNAERIDFDIPTYYLNPKESIEMGIMLKFFADDGIDNVVIFRSEYLSIPDVKLLIEVMDCSITFFGVFKDKDNLEYKSSYYLDRLYK